MAKKVTGIVKLQIPAGQANPAPPVGPALGQQGVNIMAFLNRKAIFEPSQLLQFLRGFKRCRFEAYYFLQHRNPEGI